MSLGFATASLLIMASLQVQMEAYAFRQLVEHLQWRGDVANIDLMNLSGFCRNCLAKWLAAGAAVYGVPMEYAEACERVYGEPLKEWKKKHQKPATEAQLAEFGNSAQHARTEPKILLAAGAPSTGSGGVGGHSSVCGSSCDPEAPPVAPGVTGPAVAARVAVLTCSDRAHQGIYKDESGPAVVASMSAYAERSQALAPQFVHQRVVPDEEDVIAQALRDWCEADGVDIVITTGGTGLGPRDVTPEATQRVLARPAEGLARAMAWQTSFSEPHSVLSRGVCGVTSRGVLVVNLPGNPGAVRQCLSVLLPVLPRALQMLGAAGSAGVA